VVKIILEHTRCNVVRGRLRGAVLEGELLLKLLTWPNETAIYGICLSLQRLNSQPLTFISKEDFLSTYNL
jgi:hypothetical protein